MQYRQYGFMFHAFLLTPAELKVTTIFFSSLATNLVANDTNGASDIFIHDRQTGQRPPGSALTT